MKDSKTLKVILIVLALPLMIFGAWRLFAPTSFYAFNGLELPHDAGLASGVRAAGAVILSSGFAVARGAIRSAAARPSVALAALIFLSLGLGRLLGLILDGSPGRGVIQGMSIELAFGALALIAFFKYAPAEPRA
jgi:hypothetical protein